MSAVFLDTVGLLALWDVSDQWHADADVAFQQLTDRQMSFVTTSYVLLECGNAAARRPYRDEVDRLRLVLERRGELIFPTRDDWDAAWEAYRRREAGQAGIVDHVSFVVMRRLELDEAFTNDQHFRSAGFRTSF